MYFDKFSVEAWRRKEQLAKSDALIERIEQAIASQRDTARKSQAWFEDNKIIGMEVLRESVRQGLADMVENARAVFGGLQ